MRVVHIAATFAEGVAVRSRLPAIFSAPPVLDAAADMTPLLPCSGGIPGTWVTAPRPEPARPVTESGMTIYLHGGGFAYSNPPLERIMAYRLSQVTGRPAFAVDYRLAPAHPFPAAIEDVVAAYRSFLSQDVPAGRILLAGESAGATLLLSTLLVLAQAGDPLPAGAVALSPVTDFAANHWATPSDQGCDPADPVGDQYLAGARPDQAPQSPLYGDLRGLPPILLAVGGDEILLHDARRFAEAATTAGVDITLDIYDHMPHAFQATVVSPDACHLPTATTFLQRVGEWVARFPAAPAVR